MGCPFTLSWGRVAVTTWGARGGVGLPAAAGGDPGPGGQPALSQLQHGADGGVAEGAVGEAGHHR